MLTSKFEIAVSRYKQGRCPGRLLLELYEHWCWTRFGTNHETPTPTSMRGFENYLQSVVITEGPSTSPLHAAWEAYLGGMAERTAEPAAEEPLPFAPEPEVPRRRSRSSPPSG